MNCVTAPAISVRNIGKHYRLKSGPAYQTLRDHLAGWLRFGRHMPAASGDSREFWALREVGFEITRGETVGIIGRNGAGKSTLLKVLSRITNPTEGTADIFGRVGSLLEVGTGFHPELSGRENIFLNGAILGMKRAEIRSRFDSIVSFAEVEKFLDTPVKHYSSGMYTRLAFAVAAHLEPEILIVDEVLAVGDARFQKKCLDKMEQVGRGGRTVLFVSHNMQAVTRLCPRVILLDAGRIIEDGPSHKVVSRYLHTGMGTTAAREWPDPSIAPGNEVVRLRSVRVIDESGRICESADIRRPVGIRIEFDVLATGHQLTAGFSLTNEDGTCVFISHDMDTEWKHRLRRQGSFVSIGWIPGNLLAEGSLATGVSVSTTNPFRPHLWEPDAVAFQVIDSLDGDSARGDIAGRFPGVVRPLLKWSNAGPAEASSPESNGLNKT